MRVCCVRRDVNKPPSSTETPTGPPCFVDKTRGARMEQHEQATSALIDIDQSHALATSPFIWSLISKGGRVERRTRGARSMSCLATWPYQGMPVARLAPRTICWSRFIRWLPSSLLRRASKERSCLLLPWRIVNPWMPGPRTRPLPSFPLFSVLLHTSRLRRPKSKKKRNHKGN